MIDGDEVASRPMHPGWICERRNEYRTFRTCSCTRFARSLSNRGGFSGVSVSILLILYAQRQEPQRLAWSEAEGDIMPEWDITPIVFLAVLAVVHFFPHGPSMKGGKR